MNIKILDSWLREFVKTNAPPQEIAENLSLTSVSVERLEQYGSRDWTYDIEVTTNRPDLMSVVGLAREAAAALSQSGIKAEFLIPNVSRHPELVSGPHEIPNQARNDNTPNNEDKPTINIKNDPKLVRRICAVIMEVKLKPSPTYIKDRLESSDIRSLNNLIDITNYIMREMGHPTHVFDYDRLKQKTLIIREAYPGEKVITLDKKEYELPGGDIIADDGTNHIVDLMGVMGTENSVVTNNTKRVLFFIDNVEPVHIRKTSMSTGIRTEAAVLNEKGIDPELSMQALLRGIELYKEIADAKLLSDIIDIYPDKPKQHTVNVSLQKINDTIGIEIPLETSVDILKKLGFEVDTNEFNHSPSDQELSFWKRPESFPKSLEEERSRSSQDDNTTGPELRVQIPSWRLQDVQIPEDIIEEIARVYGYHKLPSIVPPIHNFPHYHQEKDEFYWEKRVKDALKYFGFYEVYTYSMVSQDLLEGPDEEAVTLKNPLTDDMVYMRKTLVPSLLQVVKENKNREKIKIFELANVYHKKKDDLPEEILTLAGIVKKSNVSFYKVKGILEKLFQDLGMKNLVYKETEHGVEGADVYMGSNQPQLINMSFPRKRESAPETSENRSPIESGMTTDEYLGTIEILEDDLINFEFNFETILRYVNLKKIYTPVAKFPPVIEDIRLELKPNIPFIKIEEIIKEQSSLVKNVQLLDVYENKKTFRIMYQDPDKNLTNEEITPIREKIMKALEKELKAKIV